MKHRVAPEELPFYIGGQYTRRRAGGGEDEFEIVSLKLGWFGSLKLEVLMPSAVGGNIRKSIKLRLDRAHHDYIGGLILGGRGYDNRPVILRPHPDKKNFAVVYAEAYWRERHAD